MLIGIIGPIGSGKSTVAKHLVEAYDFERLPFAKRLKEMARAFGLSEAQINGELKQTPTKWGWTPREFMQWLGTEFGREKLGKSIWIDTWIGDVSHLRALGYARIVADDLRFENEVHAIRGLGGVAVKIVRPDNALTAFAGHASEQVDALPYDFQIINSGSIADLLWNVDQLVEMALVRSAAE